MERVNLKILPNIHCEVYLDGEFQCIACKDNYTKLNLRPGEYDVVLLGTYNHNYKLSYSILLEYDKIIRADFISEAKRHRDWHKEEDFVSYDGKGGTRVWQNLITSEVLQSRGDEITDIRVDDGNLYFIGKKDGLCALLDASGKELTPFIYESIKGFSNGLAPVIRNGKWGFVDNEGKEIIPCNYGLKYDSEFRKNTLKQYIILKDMNGNYGMINKENKTIIPFVFKDLYWGRDQHGRSTSYVQGVYQSGKRGVLDLSGSEILIGDFGYIRINSVNNTIVFAVGVEGEWVETNYKYGICHYLNAKWNLYSIDGLQLGASIYDEVSCNDDGGIIVIQSGLYGLINASGETILECKYDKIDSLEVSWYRFQLDDKYGIANIYGDTTPCHYEEAWVNRKHLIAKIGNLYGVFSHYGVPVIPPAYQEIRDLKDERYSVKLNGKWGIINSKGNPIIPFRYDQIEETYADAYIVRNGDHIGLLDWDGGELLACIYDAEHEIIIQEQAEGSPYRNINGNADFLTFTIDGNEIYYDIQKKQMIEPFRKIECYDSYAACEFAANNSCYTDGIIKLLVLKENKRQNLICIIKKKGGKYGLENIMGEIILQAKYKSIEKYGNAYQVWDPDGCAFYDKYGNLLLSAPAM